MRTSVTVLLTLVASARAMSLLINHKSTESANDDRQPHPDSDGDMIGLSTTSDSNEQARQQDSDEKFASDFLLSYGYFHQAKSLPLWSGPENPKHNGMTGRQKRDAQSDAIRMFQNYYGLLETGKLNQATLQLMKEGRCGVGDIPNEATSSADSSRRKWVQKYVLTWDLVKPSNKLNPLAQKESIRKAFATWARVIPLEFRENTGEDRADIEMRFEVGQHGDSNPFDGPSRVLAHAYGPGSVALSGDVHFDNDETWVVHTEKEEGQDLQIVATHELGHSLGLPHSRNPQALMFAYYGQGSSVTLKLSPDDIWAIQAKYGVREGPTEPPEVPTTPRHERIKSAANMDYPDEELTSTNSPVKCNLQFDVIFQDDAQTRNAYTGIKEDLVFRFTKDGLLHGYPKRLHDIYPDAPARADCVFTVTETESTYFMKGSQVWKYTNYILQDDYPRNLDRTHFPEKIRFILPLMDQTRTKRTFIFGTTNFYEYDFEAPIHRSSQLHSISKYWPHVPRDILYAFVGGDNYIYFVSSESHVILDESRKVINGDRQTGQPEFMQNVCNQITANQSSGGAINNDVNSLTHAFLLLAVFVIRP